MLPSRRTILTQLSASTLSACATGGSGGRGRGKDTAADDPSSADTGDSGNTGDTGNADQDAWLQVCEDGSTVLPDDCSRPTPLGGEGPFLRDDVPERVELNVRQEDGQPMVLTGRVLHHDCTPFPDVEIIVWMAGGDARFYDTTSDDAQLYGKQTTDAAGAFCFRTLRPLPYGEGEQTLPAHIHIVVNQGEQRLLTTQLAFDGDPYLPNDPRPPELIVTPETLSNGDELVIYDFIVPENLSGGMR